jgi:aminoglycoside phosphotransferase family enzyme
MRIAAGAIVEGHGDLRPEHVCVRWPIQIIDCLEFNRWMRIIDPYDEVNYLGLECEMLGAPWIRPLLHQALRRRLPLEPTPGLLALHGGFRALLRARLSIVHLREKPVRHPEKWRPLAIRYIRQAERECLSSRSREYPKSARAHGGA